MAMTLLPSEASQPPRLLETLPACQAADALLRYAACMQYRVSLPPTRALLVRHAALADDTLHFRLSPDLP